MEGFLNHIRLFWGWVFPYISRIHTAYIGVSYLQFRYLKSLVTICSLWDAWKKYFGGKNFLDPKSYGKTKSLIWSNYSDLTRVFTPNGGLVREIPLFQGNLGW